MPYTTNNWITVRVSGSVIGANFEYDFDYRSDAPVDYTNAGQLGNSVISDILTPLAAFQHSSCITNHVNVFNRSISMPAYDIYPTLVGSFTTDPDDFLPSAQAWGIYEVVGESFNATTDDEVTNRAIKRGFVHLPGISDDWVSNGNRLVPTAELSAWTAWLEDTVEPITTSGNEFTRIIRGAFLAPTPDKPVERPEVYAFVTESIWRKLSWVGSRES